LKRTGNAIKNNTEMTPETIYYDIAVQSKSVTKIPCLCEDNYGANMLKALIETSDEYSVEDYEFIDTQSSYNTLKKLIENENKYMQHNIYVVDGDHPEVINDIESKGIKHTGITLPINAPEVVISKFITSEIPSDNPIFLDYTYNKQE